MTNSFWQTITNTLTTITNDKPNTFDKVKAILDNGTDPKTDCKDTAFFGGSGGDDQLEEALYRAGWDMLWIEASYYYIMQHDVTGETLTYIEGDLYRGHDSEKVDS